MDAAVISRIDEAEGARIAEHLIRLGYRVYGFATDPSRVSLENKDLRVVKVVPGRLDSQQAAAQEVLEKEKRVSALILRLPGEPFATIRETALRTLCEHALDGFVLPLAMVKIFLPSLLQSRGNLVLLTHEGAAAESVTDYGEALQAGLSQLLASLTALHGREGLRCTRLRVVREAVDGRSTVDPSHLGEAIEGLLRYQKNTVVSDLTLRSLPESASGQPPVYTAPPDTYASPQLPAAEGFPVEPEPIPTRRPMDSKAMHRAAGTSPGSGEEEKDDELDQALATGKDLDPGSGGSRRRRRGGGGSRRRGAKPKDGAPAESKEPAQDRGGATREDKAGRKNDMPQGGQQPKSKKKVAKKVSAKQPRASTSKRPRKVAKKAAAKGRQSGPEIPSG